MNDRLKECKNSNQGRIKAQGHYSMLNLATTCVLRAHTDVYNSSVYSPLSRLMFTLLLLLVVTL